MRPITILHYPIKPREVGFTWLTCIKCGGAIGIRVAGVPIGCSDGNKNVLIG